MPKLAVITPVGPGHECYIDGLRKLRNAFQHIIVDDAKGELGRSRARNIGMDYADSDTDWFFFLDADDEFHEGFERNAQRAIDQHPSADVLLGSLSGVNSGGHEFVPAASHFGRGWNQLTKTPARFCISGLFRAEEAREHRFLEGVDKGEDVEFVLSFCAGREFRLQVGNFTWIRCDRPSAIGPRGYESLDWGGAIQPIMAFWKHRGAHPMPVRKRTPDYWRKKR